MPNRPSQKPDAIPPNPNTANMSAVLMESSVCRDIWRGGPLAALLKGIRSIRAEFCDAQQTTCCSDASIRSAALPGIRTTGKFVRSYEASRWYGVAVPRNTPLEVVDKLNREINLLIEAFKRAYPPRGALLSASQHRFPLKLGAIQTLELVFAIEHSPPSRCGVHIKRTLAAAVFSLQNTLQNLGPRYKIIQ